jgi:hypothetical protein
MSDDLNLPSFAYRNELYLKGGVDGELDSQFLARLNKEQLTLAALHKDCPK